MVDGYCGGNPPDCSGGMMNGPGKMAPMPDVAPPMPEVAPEPVPPEAPAKSTRRPLFSPRFSAKPIGAGLQ